MKKNDQIKLEDFKVNELEQRLEMGSWSAGMDETPDPNNPIEYESTPYVRYTMYIG